MNKVVVTVKAEGAEMDFELPTNITVQELKGRLLTVLRTMNATCLPPKASYVLNFEGRGLLRNLDATLDEYGILTGSVLELMPEEA